LDLEVYGTTGDATRYDNDPTLEEVVGWAADSVEKFFDEPLAPSASRADGALRFDARNLVKMNAAGETHFDVLDSAGVSIEGVLLHGGRVGRRSARTSSGAVPDQLSRAVGRVRPRARIISFARCHRALLLGRGGVVAGGGASTRTSAADYSRPGLISGLQIDATSVVLSRLFSFFRRIGGPGGRGRRAAQKEAGTPTVYGPAGPVLANGPYLRAPNRCHVGRFESSLLVLSADRSPPGAWATSRTE
jgi:hypothetical protein